MAARLGVSQRFAPVSQSGLSLTDRVAPRIFALHPRPPILCGHGDAAGQQATARWATRAITVLHREVLTLTLPDGLDPADWLTTKGDQGLVTFSRGGCLTDIEHVRAQPAGALLAKHELNRAMGATRRHTLTSRPTWSPKSLPSASAHSPRNSPANLRYRVLPPLPETCWQNSSTALAQKAERPRS